MSELSKIIMGAATPEQIAELLAEVSETAGVEIPSKPENWKVFSYRIESAVSHLKKRADCVEAWQRADIEMRRC